MRKLAALLSLLFIVISLRAASDSIRQPLIEFGGVLRLRAEVDTHSGETRLAVRNARLNVRGHLIPSLTYLLQADICDQGKFLFLDGYLQGELGSGWTLRGGQFRVPFGRDVFRIPGRYIFVNRSFLTRDILNMRAVGGQASYTTPGFPLTLTGGIFSPQSISSHTRWTTQFTYAAKAVLPIDKWRLEASFASAAPDSVRYNMADAAVTFTPGALTLEAEYAYKHYTRHSFAGCHAWSAWGSYDFRVRLPRFKIWSVQARFDGTTAHSNGVRHDDGRLHEDNPRRNRLTLGTTLVAPLPRAARVAIHLNYEKYFYPGGYIAPVTRRDAICAEITALF